MRHTSGPGVAAHRSRDGSRPCRPCRGAAGSVRHSAAAACVQDAGQGGGGREGRHCHRWQASHRRRFQPDGPDDGGNTGLAAGHVRFRGDRSGRQCAGEARGGWWLGDSQSQVASSYQC